MGGPWEAYQSGPSSDGPWSAYAVPKQPENSGEWSGSVGISGKPGVVEDVVKSLPGAIPRAAAGLVGLPQTIGELVEAGGRAMGFEPKRSLRNLPEWAQPGKLVTKGYDKLSEAVTGSPVYRPQTGPGRIADMTAQAVIGGPGSLTQKAVTGAAAGTTGEVARLAGVENPLALGVLQLLGAGAASLPFILRGVPAANINDAIKNITPADLTKAQALMDDAARMGSPLTGAEAIAQVTGKNSLQDIQRVVEASRKGGPIMQQTMNERPQAARTAFETRADQVGQMPAEPARTPPRMQAAAETAITRARQAGNAAASPDYAVAATQSVPASEWNTLVQQPAAQKALGAVKAATEYGVTNEREGSIRWIDAAKRWLDAKIQNANTPPAEQRIWEQGRRDLVDAADRASAEYRRGRATVAQNQQTVVQPMRESPVGDIAGTKNLPAESAMRQQSEILMPQSPRALDPQTIKKAVQTIERQDPGAARDWVRQNLQAVFDEQAQNLSAGANQWGGAKFAAQIAGNPRQKANLQALVESVAGPKAWNGFNRMLEVLEAQGKRQAPGSQTAFNQQIQADLSAGGAMLPAALMGSPGRVTTVIHDAYQRFRFGKDTEQMARILTDLRSVEKMRELAREAPTSARAAMLTAEILALQQPGSVAQSNSGDR